MKTVFYWYQTFNSETVMFPIDKILFNNEFIILKNFQESTYTRILLFFFQDSRDLLAIFNQAGVNNGIL